MPDPQRFPDALRASAVPRWSHRDPVEGGNPFPEDDERHEIWGTATSHAREALAEIDCALDEAERAGAQPDPYAVRLVALAESRFDVWARRLRSIVRGPEALQDFETWLTAYVVRWLDYVAETCPKVDVGDTLRTRLESRVRYWLDEARRTLEAAGR